MSGPTTTALATALAALLPAAALAEDAGAARSPGEVAAEMFRTFDTNGDGRIESDEFAAGVADGWTRGGDLGPVDFHAGWQTWFAAPQPAFESYDDDGDGRLGREELHESLAAADLRGAWQGADDGYLTPEEFATGLTAVLDRDGDGRIDEGTLAYVAGSGGPADPAGETGATGVPSVDPPFDPPDVAPEVIPRTPCGSQSPEAADCP